jgi:hypothetical protein
MAAAGPVKKRTAHSAGIPQVGSVGARKAAPRPTFGQPERLLWRSIGHISRLQRVSDKDADGVAPLDMLAQLREDDVQRTARTRASRSR